MVWFLPYWRLVSLRDLLEDGISQHRWFYFKCVNHINFTGTHSRVIHLPPQILKSVGPSQAGYIGCIWVPLNHIWNIFEKYWFLGWALFIWNLIKMIKSRIFEIEKSPSSICWYMYFDPLITNINSKNRNSIIQMMKTARNRQKSPICVELARFDTFLPFWPIQCQI